MSKEGDDNFQGLDDLANKAKGNDAMSVQEPTFQNRKNNKIREHANQEGSRGDNKSRATRSVASSYISKHSSAQSQTAMYMNIAAGMGVKREGPTHISEAGDEEIEGFSVIGAALSIISTIIGGGIISIPYAMTTNGIMYGAGIHLVTLTFLMFTAHLYLSAKDMYDVPSFSELCYMCFGRSSVYLINLLIAFVIFGILILYMILFSKISISLLPQGLSQDPLNQNWLEWIALQKVTYIAIVCVLSIQTMLKKSLAELKFQSRILFVGVISLLVILTVKQFEDRAPIVLSDKKGFELENFIDSINITLTSYGFIINLFPIASQMKAQTYGNVMSAVFIALCFCFSAYLILSILAQNLFGDNIEVSLFDNMKDDRGILSVGVRVLFLVIFLCNIPYLFFPGKMSILNALQEYRFKVFSRVLEANIKQKERDLAIRADDFNNVSGQALSEIAIEKEVDVINDCDNKTYYGVCFTFLAAVVAAALLLDDLSLIFGMIAAFSESMLNFVLPGLFFLTGLNYVGINNVFLKFVATVFTCIGLLYFTVSNYFNFIKFQRMGV